MQVLRIEHMDFKLSVECNSLEETFARARQKQPALIQATSYKASAIQGEILMPGSDHWLSLEQERLHPVFFENKEYFFWIEFNDVSTISDASVRSRLKEVEERFHFRAKAGVLTGSVNFRNDIGKSELIIHYNKEQKPQQFVFSFEVFPVKLDYRSDYRKMLHDIESKYPLLVLDFLRKTFSTFKEGHSKNTDLIWWQIFGGLYHEFVQASKFILNRPRIRLQKITRYVKADQIIHLTPALEENLSRFRDLPDRSYRISHPQSTTDTVENQFFKQAVQKTEERFTRVTELIKKKYRVSFSDAFAGELSLMGKELKTIRNHPFFRSISEFRGIRQESPVLQKANGYSTIYKSWIMLNAGISFLEGIQKLELKNIAELYQIWCFLEMKEMLREIIGQDPAEVSLAQLKVDNFVFEFRAGQRSKVAFRTDSNEEIILFHDYQFEKDQGTTRSFTVAQRPDIVLQITSNDLRDKYTLTYLYDAKYRLQSDEDVSKPDLPPDDAINQMHRYRDAIYYSNKTSTKPEKEVIGAYVLFPGTGEPEEIRSLPYSRSVSEVNIGAFPLRPGDEANSILLREHLYKIIKSGTENILNDIIPHKGNVYEPTNPAVLIGIVKEGVHSDYFESGMDLVYHTGNFSEKGFEEFLAISSRLKYFAPNFSGKGVCSYYEIKQIIVQRRCDIFEKGALLYKGDDLSERIVIQLGRKYLIRGGKYLSAKITVYGYTSLKNIRNPTENAIDLISKEILFQ